MQVAGVQFSCAKKEQKLFGFFQEKLRKVSEEIFTACNWIILTLGNSGRVSDEAENGWIHICICVCICICVLYLYFYLCICDFVFGSSNNGWLRDEAEDGCIIAFVFVFVLVFAVVFVCM